VTIQNIPMQYRALVALLLGAVATALPAQTSRDRERDRDIERRVERLSRSIGRTVDASVEGAMRVVESTLGNLERRQGYDSRQGGSSIDTTFTFSADGTVDLTSFNGDITVTGWTRNQARVRARTERGSLSWRITPNRISVETDMFRGRTGETTYEVTVPEGVRVILRSMNGSLTVRGVKGSADLHTNNGDVEVTDGAGRMEMVTLSGDVTGLRLRGEVRANSLNGTVSLTDVQGRAVRAESTSGDLELTNVVSPDVGASTVSGDVSFIGPLERQGQYSFQAHSGTVTLTIPATTSARFSVETFSGDVDSDFPFTLQPNRERRRGQRLEFTVGAGEARVNAESFSGGIIIKRAGGQRR
jgi:DUF4097 and DUF4098 domain-containing protein YvlB